MRPETDCTAEVTEDRQCGSKYRRSRVKFHIPKQYTGYFEKPGNGWIYDEAWVPRGTELRGAKPRIAAILLALLDGIDGSPLSEHGVTSWDDISPWLNPEKILAPEEYPAAVHVSAGKVVADGGYTLHASDLLSFHSYKSQGLENIWQKKCILTERRWDSEEAEIGAKKFGQGSDYWYCCEDDSFSMGVLELWPTGLKDFDRALEVMNRNFHEQGYALTNQKEYQLFKEIENTVGFGVTRNWDHCAIWSRIDTTPHFLSGHSFEAVFWSEALVS